MSTATPGGATWSLPKISVSTPVYKAARYRRSAFKSVLDHLSHTDQTQVVHVNRRVIDFLCRFGARATASK